jgi:hypothetical protein
MSMSRILPMLLTLVLAASPVPASVRTGCGLLIASSDPELRLNFRRFEAVQSPTAARACGVFLNNATSA